MNALDILQMKLIKGKDLYENEQLEKQKKFDFLKSQNTSSEVLEYVNMRLQYLTIEFMGNFKKYAGNILYLMKKEQLEGWC